MITNEFKLNRITEMTAADVRRMEKISEFGYYPIGGSSLDSINPVTQNYMIRDSYYQWLKNPIANTIIESLLDFTLGDGINYKANDPKVNDVLDDFYYDINNQWDRKSINRFRDLFLFGELVLKTNVTKHTGRLKTYSVSSELITECFRDKDNLEDILALKFRDDDKQYKVITRNMDKVDDDLTKYEGDIFFWRINNTTHQTRGLSELFVVRDWLQLWDKALYTTMERIGLLLAFVWDITIEGASEKDLRNKLNVIRQNPPQPGGVHVHNQKEKWNALTPSLQGSDLDTIFRLCKSPILAQTRLPEHFLGLGGQVNYATSLSMNSPFYRRIKRRQKEIIYIFNDMFDYQIWLAKQANMLAGVEDFGYDVMIPEPDKEIMVQIADTLQKFSGALVTLASNGYMEHKDVKKITQLIVSVLGVNLETEETETQIEEGLYNKTAKYVKALKK